MTPSAPLFVPRTPGGALAEILKRIESDLNKVSLRRVKIIEEGGSTIHDLLVKSNPLAVKLCIRDNARFVPSQIARDCAEKGQQHMSILAPSVRVRRPLISTGGRQVLTRT